MRNSSFKPRVYERKPVTYSPIERAGVVRMVADEVVANLKEVRAKVGKYAPNEIERKWMDAIVGFGCVACWLDGNQPRPTAVHHILRGGQRIGHLFTLPLCDPGHHQNGRQFGLISRHPWKAQFEERYGDEKLLLAMLKVKLGFFDKYEVTK
jgi:hypothetical protein